MVPVDQPAAWQAYADAVLQREALLWRLGSGVAPRDLAGWYVTGEDVDRVLSGLPGLDGAPHAVAEALRERLAPDLDRARAGLVDDLAGESRFARLARSAHLDPDTAATLAVLAAVEVSPSRQRLVGYLHDDVRLPRVTLSLLQHLGATDHRATTHGATTHGATTHCAPDAALVRLGLVVVEPTGPWATRTVTVADRVLWHLLGDDATDPALPARTRHLDAQDPAGDLGDPARPSLLLVHGGDRESRRQAARHWAPRSGLLVTRAPATPEAGLALVREAVVEDRVLVIELEAELTVAHAVLVERTPELVWVLSTPVELALEDVPDVSWCEISCTDRLATEEDWQSVLGRSPAAGHQLDREQLRLVGTALTAGASSVSAAVRRLAAGHLDGLALRTTPRQGWSDLILPTDQLDQLGELAARYRSRPVVFDRWKFSPHPSTGVVALFSGHSGTGKTLAAEVMAGELGLDLYRVDLSSVVSKYIGETEKNLNRIFDAARAAEVVLFFDEADALFGKRSEVSDAHDRYANIEVAFLLQRLEAHDGVVIMATNLQRNIDAAFLRRIAVSVDFPQPDERHRRRIWAHHFPPTAPLVPPGQPNAVDLDFLAAQFAITGGMIRNAVISSAFLAAEQGAEIGMEQVIRALKREFQKAGRLRTEVEFDRYHHLIADPDDDPDDDAEPTRSTPPRSRGEIHAAAAR